MGEGMADCESAAVPTDKLQPAIPGQPRITRRRPQSIQQVVQSGARLTVVHCPLGSVLTSVSEAPKSVQVASPGISRGRAARGGPTLPLTRAPRALARQ